jgi:Methyltransferase domain
MTKLDEMLQHIATAFTQKTMLKITIGNLREKKSYLKNIFIKPVVIKDAAMLSFVYRHTDKDVTKNFLLEEAITTIKKMLESFFYNAELYTTSQTIYFTEDAKTQKQKIIIKALSTPLNNNSTLHDKQKNRIIKQDAFYLKELGVTTSEGKVKAEMQHKFRQINRYVEIIEGILKDTEIKDNFTVVDMGSGKGYLTFALYSFLQEKNKHVKVSGIELREDLVVKCNDIASQSNYEGLLFKKGSIKDWDMNHADMLIALHACDTATDDAIAKGVIAQASHIICAPCCHKQIRKQMAPSNALKNITKHGILLERQAEMVTDTIRALILESQGYKTKVFDFIEEENTPKNVLIVGKRTISTVTDYRENLQKISDLKNLFGIKEHYLETLLGRPLFV